jgi:integrase
MPGCRPLTDDEVDLVMQSFGGRYATRDRALFLLGIYTGFRITELLSLRLNDVYQHGEVLTRVSVPRRNMKGQYASRSVPLHHHAQLALAAWIGEMPTHGEVTPASFVFRSREGGNKPISRMHAHRILREAYDSCELTGNLGTHSMRKTFAKRVHGRLGNDLAKTKEALGQKNIQATMHYMSFLDEEIDQAILQQ